MLRYFCEQLAFAPFDIITGVAETRDYVIADSSESFVGLMPGAECSTLLILMLIEQIHPS